MWSFILVALLAYLIGSIPFGLLLTRAAGLGDIRAIGSGNIGATNVLRTGKKGLAALTLVLDAAKGAAAVIVAASHGPALASIAALAVVVGHIFPVWLGFKGGKGVATAAGALAAYAWPVALAGGATWLVVIALTRYSSLAAIVACVLAPIYALALVRTPLATVTILVIAVLVLTRHHANMARLIRGEESRISLGHGK